MAGLKYNIIKVCEFCGKDFEAQKVTTQYCSHRCSSLAYKERKRNEKKEIAQREAMIKSRVLQSNGVKDCIYLSVADAAQKLGVSRQTVYNLINSGALRATRLTDRLCFITMKDIDEMILSNRIGEYRAHPPKDPIPITDLYTIAEIKEKYKVKESWIFKVIKDNDIPKILHKGKTHVSRKHIDEYFSDHNPDPSIKVWVTSSQLQLEYGMTLQNIYGFVHDNAVPRKKEGALTYYSKEHFDRAKRGEEPAEPEYYTMVEAMEAHGMTRDALYHHVKRHNIPKIKVGKYTKISKRELDESLKAYIIK
ncbi:MAG: helix-turn-helix domain-containing protein [Rikenellaceae bacterium]